MNGRGEYYTCDATCIAVGDTLVVCNREGRRFVGIVIEVVEGAVWIRPRTWLDRVRNLFAWVWDITREFVLKVFYWDAT